MADFYANKSEKFKKHSYAINVAKRHLLNLQRDLERDGINRKARSLGNIIASLEEWQSKSA